MFLFKKVGGNFHHVVCKELASGFANHLWCLWAYGQPPRMNRSEGWKKTNFGMWCLGCDVWVQTKNMRLFLCLLFMFVGSLVTVNFRNLDFPLKKTSEHLCFVGEPWGSSPQIQACSWPQSKPKSSMAAMGVFQKNGAKNSQVQRANFDDQLWWSTLQLAARIGVQLLVWGPGGLGFSRLGV